MVVKNDSIVIVGSEGEVDVKEKKTNYVVNIGLFDFKPSINVVYGCTDNIHEHTNKNGK